MAWFDRGIPKSKVAGKVLLIGNGPNRLSHGHSWRELLQALQAFTGRDINFKKPFPLLYEEVMLLSASRKIPEAEIMRRVAEKVTEFEPTLIHQKLLATGANHILTTNYDFSIQKAIDPNFNTFINEGIIREARYSLFRKINIDGYTVWPIHGSLNLPKTIMLGYDHYSGYLERMRAYVTSAAVYQNKSLKSLMARLNDGEKFVRSWLDLVFMRDVYILGLTLDFVEIHLWWLLTYWGRKKIERKFRFKNQITYFMPEFKGRLNEPQKAQKDLFDAIGVSVKLVQVPDNKSWETYYISCLDQISAG